MATAWIKDALDNGTNSWDITISRLTSVVLQSAMKATLPAEAAGAPGSLPGGVFGEQPLTFATEPVSFASGSSAAQFDNQMTTAFG
ncbi:hypothetical protein VE03_00675 [Pseudogymnoascus sp. 23342-1-I1]|nr:hypothetical protein VE03_00675 [Pseudogymnoascus sp. 23342-1-I1]